MSTLEAARSSQNHNPDTCTSTPNSIPYFHNFVLRYSEYAITDITGLSHTLNSGVSFSLKVEQEAD
jgi:hypothetical protein